MALTIYIARHGQNEDNANGILNGHRDMPLTALGIQQAHDLASGIAKTGITFDAVYASPLVRALETARILCRELHLVPPQILELLIERDFGIMTGQPTARIAELCAPDIIETETITYFLNPEGAETFPQLVDRGYAILRDISVEHNDETILLVCHGDIGKMIYAAATNTPWRKVLTDFHFGNGDLIQLDTTDGAHVVKLPQHNV